MYIAIQIVAPSLTGGNVMPSKYRYALWGLVALCFTVLCVVWMLKDRLCEVTISDGHMQMRAVVAYESKK